MATKITTKIADYPSLVALAGLTDQLRDARRATEQTVMQRDESGRIVGTLKLPPPDVAPIVARGVALSRKIATEHLSGGAHLLYLAVEADFADAAGFPDLAQQNRELLAEEGVRAEAR